MNHELKKLSQWLKTNKLSLNVDKTKLITFRLCSKMIADSIKFKLDGKRLIATDDWVKYLSVYPIF